MIRAHHAVAAALAALAAPAHAFDVFAPPINAANASSYQISGGCSPGASIQANFSMGGAPFVVTTTCGGNGLYTTLPTNLTAYPDGTVTLIVTQNGASAIGKSLLKDTVYPTVTLNLAGGIVAMNQGAFPVNGTCSEIGRTVNIVANLNFATGPVVHMGVPCTTGFWSATLPLGSLPRGTISIDATQSDAAGNAAGAQDYAEKYTGNRWRHSFAASLDDIEGVDLAWRHPSGAHGYWLTTPGLRGSFTPVGLPASPGREIAKIANLSGFYKRDVLWRDATGAYYIGLAPPAPVLGTAGAPVLLYGGGTGWDVIEAADFDGDGKDDLLWKHPSAGFALWLMDGGTIRGVSFVNPPLPGYVVALVGDFNGDGKSDILWTHPDGSAWITLMNGATVISDWHVLGPGTGWTPKLVADFNADDKADLLWRHADGSWGVWLMDGWSILQAAPLRGPASGWDALLVRDFNGDGRGDIVWQSTDGRGAYEIWPMDGTSSLDRQRIFDGGSGWFVVGSGDYDSDGMDDLLWRSTAGDYAIWYMRGASPTNVVMILGGGSGWEVTGP